MIAVVDGYCTYVPSGFTSPFVTAHNETVIPENAFPEGSSYNIYRGVGANMKDIFGVDHPEPPKFTDAVASVVYDILQREGILEEYTLDDAINELVANVRDMAGGQNTSDEYDALLHASVKDFVECICPVAEECFDECC